MPGTTLLGSIFPEGSVYCEPAEGCCDGGVFPYGLVPGPCGAPPEEVGTGPVKACHKATAFPVPTIHTTSSPNKKNCNC